MYPMSWIFNTFRIGIIHCEKDEFYVGHYDLRISSIAYLNAAEHFGKRHVLQRDFISNSKVYRNCYTAPCKNISIYKQWKKPTLNSTWNQLYCVSIKYRYLCILMFPAFDVFSVK